jgi:hypothetical protein
MDTDRPIKAGPALQCFLNHSDYFGPLNPSEIINPTQHSLTPLMDKLPNARNGLGFYGTMESLLWIYITNNSLKFEQIFTPDDIMKQCFGGEIPAQNIYIDERDIKMSDALDEGLIDYPLNTFDTIKYIYPQYIPPEFPTECSTYITQNLVTLNSHRVIARSMKSELQKEYNIVRKTMDQWNKLLYLKETGEFTSEQEGLFEDYMSGSFGIKEPEYS